MVKFELKKISLEILNNWHKIRSFFFVSSELFKKQQFDVEGRSR